MRPRAQLFSALVLTFACEKYELISLTEQYSHSFFHGRKAEEDTCSAVEDVRGPQKEIALAKPKRAKIKGKYIYYRVYAKIDMKALLKDLPKLDVSPGEVIAQVSAVIAWLLPGNAAITTLIRRTRAARNTLLIPPVYAYEPQDWPKIDDAIDEF
jgi:hypothetical protein